MRCLVTGAGGFVGRHLCRALLEQGHTVVQAVKHPERVDAAASGLPGHAGDWARLDVTDWEAVQATISSMQPDRIFHLAAITFVPQAVREPMATYHINFQGTLNLLEAVRLQSPGTRVVFVSSSEIYGLPQYLPVDERHPLAPRNPYSGSKAAADLACQQYVQSFGIDAVRLRPFNHTGPGQSDSFVVPGFARQVAEIELGRRPPILMVGNLEARRDFTDVRDVARAYLAVAEAGERGAAYNVSSGRSYSVRQLLDLLLSVSQARDIRIEIDPGRVRADDVPEIRGSSERVRERVGWSPQIGIEQTLTDLLYWWRSHLA